MNIEINPKESSGVDRHIQVSVPVDTVREAEEKAARRYASSVRLPGFRPGKAPAAMVRKKFAEAIRQEALEAIVRDAYQEVITKQDLKVASQPHVHDLKKLLTLLAATGVKIPKYVWQADHLTPFAVVTRYPDLVRPVPQRRYRRSVGIAEAVLRWAERLVEPRPKNKET